MNNYSFTKSHYTFIINYDLLYKNFIKKKNYKIILINKAKIDQFDFNINLYNNLILNYYIQHNIYYKLTNLKLTYKHKLFFDNLILNNNNFKNWNWNSNFNINFNINHLNFLLSETLISNLQIYKTSTIKITFFLK